MIHRKAYFKHATPKINGRGVGAVLLDGGRGGQSSYSSPEEMKATVNGSGFGATAADIKQHLATGEPFKNSHGKAPMSVGWIQSNAAKAGRGLDPRAISKISNLMMRPTAVKPKAIHFSI